MAVLMFVVHFVHVDGNLEYVHFVLYKEWVLNNGNLGPKHTFTAVDSSLEYSI